jgi:hypothetical protein
MDAKHQDFFASLSALEITIVKSILEQHWEELKEFELEYQAKE